MNTPRMPKYDWGQAVQATIDLYNDGSVPDAAEDGLLIAAGGPGEIVQVGHHSDGGVPLYLVDFGLVILGCLEEEIAPVRTGSPGRMRSVAEMPQ